MTSHSLIQVLVWFTHVSVAPSVSGSSWNSTDMGGSWGACCSQHKRLGASTEVTRHSAVSSRPMR